MSQPGQDGRTPIDYTRRSQRGHAPSVASNLSNTTIWPRLGQTTSSVPRPSMAPNPGRHSPEIIEWDLVPPPLNIRKRKPVGQATPSVGGSTSSRAPVPSSRSDSRTFRYTSPSSLPYFSRTSPNTHTHELPVSPVRGQSHTDDSFMRPPATIYGDRRAPIKHSQLNTEPFPEYDNRMAMKNFGVQAPFSPRSVATSVIRGDPWAPSIYSQPSRPPSIIRSQTAQQSSLGLSEYTSIQLPGDKKFPTTKWPHTLVPSNPRPQKADDFAEAFAQMSVVDNDLRNYIQVNREVIGSHDSHSKTDAERTYRDFIKSPPARPGSISSTPPTSPNAKKNKELAEHLANDAFADLLKRDQQFHDLMNDLDGIEQWWLENYRQWEDKRRDVERKLTLISEFKEQQADLLKARPRKRTTKSFVSTYEERVARVNTIDEQDEHEMFQEQIELQEYDILVIKGWFIENRMLMKEVWKKFKIMQGSLEQLERTVTAQSVKPEPSYAFNWIYSDDYRKDKLIKRHGLVWWFEQARDHLVEWEAYLAEQRGIWVERKDKYVSLEEEYRKKAQANVADYHNTEEFYDRTIQDLQNILLQEPSRQEEVDEQIERNLEMRKNQRMMYEEQEGLLNQVIFSFVVQDNTNRFRLNDFADRHWRVTTVLKIIVGVSHALDIHGYPNQQPDPKVISSIMKLAYWEAQRQEYTRKLDSLLAKEDVLGNPYNTKVLIHRGKEHFQFWQFRDKSEPLIRGTSGAIHTSNVAFERLADFWYHEFFQFRLLVDSMITQSKQKDYGQHERNEIETWKPAQLPPQPDFLPYQIRFSTMPIGDAAAILNWRRTTKSYRTGIKIFNFFNSPDIFPFFWGYTHASWTLSEFKKLLNSLVTNSIDDNSLDAFFTYCDHTGELFRISGIISRIRVSPQGWERAPEAKVSRIYNRRLTFKEPNGVVKLEELLVANKTLFNVDSTERDIKKKDLLRKINSILPEGTMDMRILNKYCNYWGGVGRMFVSTYRTKSEKFPGDSSSKDLLLRVDHGWHISKSTPWLPPTTKPPQFDQIAHKIENQIDIRPVCLRYEDRNHHIYTTEDKLYNLAYGVRTEEYSTECSRHAFHMYLRWCDREGGRFQFERNGDVRLKCRLWGDMENVSRVRQGPDLSQVGGAMPQKEEKQKLHRAKGGSIWSDLFGVKRKADGGKKR